MDVEQMSMEGEEDVFFADLKDRISLLIMEDEDREEFPVVQWPSDSFQAFSYATNRPFYAPPLFMYDHEASYRRQTAKGTGVFIPTSSILPRKKNRSSRSKQASRARKAGGPDPPSTTRAADNLSNSHAPSMCTNNTNLEKKRHQQLSTKKKGMVMC